MKINKINFGVSYEPIIELENMQIYGYEALSRFRKKDKNIAPLDLFKNIHNNRELFFNTEVILKKFQINQRPEGKKLFINLDPDVAIDSSHGSYWISYFNEIADLTVEITENADEDNACNVEEFMDWLDRCNIKYAYDDYGQPNRMFFKSLFSRVSYIKLDIDFLRTINKERAYIELAKGVTRYAKLSNKKTILEGVENEDELQIARDIGVDFVQGFLFKDKFIDIWSKDNLNNKQP